MSRKRNARGNAAKGKANKRQISVDFEGVDTVSRIPEGDYAVEVKEVTVEKAQSGNDYLRFQLAVTEGPHEGKTLRHQCSLQAHALFVLRNTLEALNYPLTDSVMDIDLDDLEGLEMGVAVIQEEYQGRTQSQVTETFSIDELFASDDEDDEDYDDEDEEDEDDEEADEEEEDEEDEDDEDDEEEEIDLDSMKLKELKAFAKENDIEHPAKITAKALRALIEEELDAEEDEDEDEDDEEYEDYTEEELEDMDDEELIDAADEYEVKPAYTGKGKKKKLNREATIDAILDVIEEDDM